MITRRTVLKAIAASIMAPTIHLRNTIPDERLLMYFCDSEYCRYDLSKPFGVGSLTYATDSHAMIRCELASRVEDGERRLPGNVMDIWERFFKPTDWIDLTPENIRPTENIMEYVTGSCPYCGDRRVSFGENHPTDQDYADTLLDWDPDDNTIRDASCEHCHGRNYDGPALVRICGVVHRSFTLRRILSLPNPQVCCSKASDVNEPDVLLFKADGFHGITLGTHPEGHC